MSGERIAIILLAAAVTYLTRVTGLALGRRAIPEPMRVFLGYVPIAAFAALIAPDLAVGGRETAPRLLGAGFAALVVYRFGTLWACIAAGMTVYWLTRWLF